MHRCTGPAGGRRVPALPKVLRLSRRYDLNLWGHCLPSHITSCHSSFFFLQCYCQRGLGLGPAIIQSGECGKWSQTDFGGSGEPPGEGERHTGCGGGACGRALGVCCVLVGMQQKDSDVPVAALAPQGEGGLCVETESHFPCWVLVSHRSLSSLLPQETGS